ncbi:hypothetical protein P8610_05795 [Fictibacillus sp. UD]|uniref:hypothetical protein n=1 Tax=Fictibacillus sp. UD TaxID=3038777 RepID=UPI0037469982
MMKEFLCTTCGTQYAASNSPLEECVICKEERQYINPNGQEWTTLDDMIQSGKYRNKMENEQDGLFSIKTEPEFGISQSAFFIEEKGFRLLWDCIPYLDQETIERINANGGIDAIALSHPHYYSTQVRWAEAFDCPLHIHEDDKELVQQESDRIIYWSGEEKTLASGLVIHRLGGHYKGGCVLHWENGGAAGILLTGDVIQVVPDRKWVSFMYSYPNIIPLPASTVERMANKVGSLQFKELYNAFNRHVKSDADLVVQRSAERYIAALKGEWFTT